MKIRFQTGRNYRIASKLAYFLRKMQISWVNNFSIPRINNAKFSGYFQGNFLYEFEHIVKFSNLH